MNELRIGRFTASEMHRLYTPAKAKTYCKEKHYERKLKQSLSRDAFSYATSWGSLLEMYVNQSGHIPPSMKFEHKNTIVHPDYDYFAGTPDIVGDTIVGDLKCPYTLNAFCDLVENCTKGITTFKDEHENYYIQLVANAILTDKNRIALMVFCPTFDELSLIAEFIDGLDPLDKVKYEWIFNEIVFNGGAKLPYLLPESDYKSFNLFEFDLIESDATDLINKIVKYSPLINL